MECKLVRSPCCIYRVVEDSIYPSKNQECNLSQRYLRDLAIRVHRRFEGNKCEISIF